MGGVAQKKKLNCRFEAFRCALLEEGWLIYDVLSP